MSCINWHGCSWSCSGTAKCVDNRVFNDGSTGPGCKAGSICCTALTSQQCATKPFRVPTKSPTPPTLSPTKSPVVICRTPGGGCSSISLSGPCNSFNGCAWNANSGICQIGGCSGTPVPTRSPTLCNDLPVAGCGAAPNRVVCEAYTCCKYSILGRCVGKDAPDPTPCSALGPSNACRNRADCRISGRRCITRGSMG
jgi:hypothetical protein